jgi:DNA mismatch endonuclease (patch repair protein)
MQRIRCRDTSPEITVRRLVCQLGFGSRYRLYKHRLPGRPDLVFPKLRKIIFVHGCFWHSHRGCDLAHVPQSRKEYWNSKLRRNKQRDRANIKKLKEDGWKILILWECQLSHQSSAAKQVAEFLRATLS